MSDEIKADETDERRLLLAHGLLSCIAARVFSGIPVEDDRREPARDAELIDMLRRTFRQRSPHVDVSDDRALGRAIEDLAITFHDEAQPGVR
jgi:hypothetical protein